MLSIHKPQRQKMYLRMFVPIEDSDQPAQSHSLIRIFAWCILDIQGCRFFVRTMETVNAQADLNDCWVHMSENAFLMLRS